MAVGQIKYFQRASLKVSTLYNFCFKGEEAKTVNTNKFHTQSPGYIISVVSFQSISKAIWLQVCFISISLIMNEIMTRGREKAFSHVYNPSFAFSV